MFACELRRGLSALIALIFAAAPAVAALEKPVDDSEKIEVKAPAIQAGAGGTVFWVDSYGRIRKDGASTNWTPQNGRFDVDPAGNAVYVDSYGHMCKNGQSYQGSSEHGGHGSALDGTLYWISGWNQELMKDEDRTGYRASWQSAIRVDGPGNVYYVNPDTRTLWRNGDDLGEHFMGLDFLVNPEGTVYYRAWVNQNASQIWSLDPTTGKKTFLDWAYNPPFLKLDAEGRPWYVGQYGRIMRDRVPMFGLTYIGAFKLDEAGHVYTRRNDDVLRDGVPTGFHVRGDWDVSPEGDVFAVTDPTWGRIEKNGTVLPFSVR